MCGEALAFVVGWLVLLHRFSSVAVVASSIGIYADDLFSTERHKRTATTTVWNDNSSDVLNGTVFATNDSFRILANNSLASISGTYTNLTDYGGATIDAAGHSDIWPSPIAVIASVVVAIVATVAAAEGLRELIVRQVSRRSSSQLMQTLTSSWLTGGAVAIDVLVLGLLIFASAVSVFHGLHFDNWNGAERFFAGGTRGVSI